MLLLTADFFLSTTVYPMVLLYEWVRKELTLKFFFFPKDEVRVTEPFSLQFPFTLTGGHFIVSDYSCNAVQRIAVCKSDVQTSEMCGQVGSESRHNRVVEC